MQNRRKLLNVRAVMRAVMLDVFFVLIKPDRDKTRP